MTKPSLLFIFILLFLSVSYGQVFKVPTGVFPIPGKDSGFDHGMLMIRQKFPGGAFIEYPKEKETLDQLKLRLAAYIYPMFGSDKDNTGKIAPQITLIPSHKGDLGSNGQMFLYAGEKGQLQILFYERGIMDKSYVYGYFAYRKKDAADKSKEWADERGDGVKFFDEFWKTISP